MVLQIVILLVQFWLNVYINARFVLINDQSDSWEAYPLPLSKCYKFKVIKIIVMKNRNEKCLILLKI